MEDDVKSKKGSELPCVYTARRAAPWALALSFYRPISRFWNANSTETSGWRNEGMRRGDDDLTVGFRDLSRMHCIRNGTEISLIEQNRVDLIEICFAVFLKMQLYYWKCRNTS